jgi:thiol-disulfide isomerase/thioredoxin
LKDKVVLLDFWATWCGPCVGEVPNVKRVYNELHPKGFEIIGISLDKNEKALKQFIAEYEIPWPQYFDGRGWGNAYGLQFNVTAIPAMFLVDKKGVLREMDAREELESKVKKLLAE